MTYSTLEPSRDSGAPTELYSFESGGTHYAYTSADEDVIYSAITYAQEPIQRTAVEETPEIGRQSLKFTVPRDNEVAALFLAGPPTDSVTLTIRRLHRGDTDAVVIWIGRVMQVEFAELTATILGESILTAIKRPGIRRRYTYSCPHALYGHDCRVSQGDYLVIGVLTNVSGAVLQGAELAGFADGYFSGGYIQIYKNDQWHRAYITAHSGVSVTCATALPVAVGDTYNAYPGCDHTLDTCDTRFSNSANYGGFPWIPLRNPMGGATLY